MRVHAVFRPHDRARCDGVDADLRAHFPCQRLGEHDQSGLGDAVDRVAAQGAQAVNVGDVQDQPAADAQRRSGRLRQEQGRFEVGADEIVPVDLRDVPERCRIEGGGIVYQDVETAERLHHRLGEPRQLLQIEQVALDHPRRLGPRVVELLGELRGGLGGAAKMDHDVSSGGVQGARYGGSHSACGARHEHGLACKRSLQMIRHETPL